MRTRIIVGNLRLFLRINIIWIRAYSLNSPLYKMYSKLRHNTYKIYTRMGTMKRSWIRFGLVGSLPRARLVDVGRQKSTSSVPWNDPENRNTCTVYLLSDLRPVAAAYGFYGVPYVIWIIIIIIVIRVISRKIKKEWKKKAPLGADKRNPFSHSFR